MTAVVGSFPDRYRAEKAITHLVANGIQSNKIGVLWRDPSLHEPDEIKLIEFRDRHEDVSAETSKGVVGGAMGGAVTGAGAVLLASAGVVLIPGLGALLVAGTAMAAAAAVAAGAFGGGLAGGVIGALIGASDKESARTETIREVYWNHLESDGYLVTVEVDPEQIAEISQILVTIGADEVSQLSDEEEPEVTLT